MVELQSTPRYVDEDFVLTENDTDMALMSRILVQNVDRTVPKHQFGQCILVRSIFGAHRRRLCTNPKLLGEE